MDRESLWRRLRYEAMDYVADIRAIIDGLHIYAGWLALVLVLAVGGMAVLWFQVALGFDRLGNVAGDYALWTPRTCRSPTDMQVLAVLVDAFFMALFALTLLGEGFRFFDRVRRRERARPGALVLQAFLVLVFGGAGIVYMRTIC